MRGLFIDHADDARIWDHQDQFLLGSALLDAPVTEPGARRRSVSCRRVTGSTYGRARRSQAAASSNGRRRSAPSPSTRRPSAGRP
ncbi:hypothetical protein ACFRQM_49405 [Streptomyces sp. NPDC056831]|uniref:hypothetical protein n=1 Tax=Streptomyces sp. NPDC056831 TaxID=3345954 RepID=UPI0036B6D38F